ncbi:MAG TPA: SDR family oxidoreductase [Pirellula sp.]|nr:SDR family oxidoreductase [Pirellula sp.]
MNLGISGKTALVTGAGRGLGEAICYALAREGVRIVAVSRTEQSLRAVWRNLGGKESSHTYHVVDLVTKAGPSRLINTIMKQGDDPDIVIHNVGGNADVKDPFCSVGDWRKVMRLNLEVSIELNNHFIPRMRERKWGRVCHISSIAAVKDRHSIPYSTAKAALNTYVRGLATVTATDNVVVTAVMPGAIKTKNGIWDQRLRRNPTKTTEFVKSRLAIQRFANCEEISEVVAFLCSKLSSFFCGPAIAVDGGTY